MNPDSRFKCNEPDVIYEVYEDEVVVLNFKNGNYYSLKETAKSIWILMAHGLTPSEIKKRFTDNCINQEEEIKKSVSDFFSSLIADELIVSSGEKILSDGKPEPMTGFQHLKDNENFAPPVLEKYTEMQELLLLDPIHEVSDTGWPARKKKSSL